MASFDEKDPFLQREKSRGNQAPGSGLPDPESTSTLYEYRKTHWVKNSHVVIHVMLISFYTCVFVFLALKVQDHDDALIYSPARNAIQYHTKPVDGLATDSVFAGDPSPELDDAWHDLLANINIRISNEEMKRLEQASLKFADGSGQLGTLGVYHELHCLKRTRKWMYRDYYYPNITRLDRLEHEKHVEHCIELLRQAIICKGDISITAFKWLGNTLVPTTKEGVLHQCVDWNQLSAWARERTVDLFDPELLVKPDEL